MYIYFFVYIGDNKPMADDQVAWVPVAPSADVIPPASAQKRMLLEQELRRQFADLQLSNPAIRRIVEESDMELRLCHNHADIIEIVRQMRAAHFRPRPVIRVTQPGVPIVPNVPLPASVPRSSRDGFRGREHEFMRRT